MERLGRNLIHLTASLGTFVCVSLASADDVATSPPSNVVPATSNDVVAATPGNAPTSNAVAETADPNEPRSETAITHTRFPNRPLLVTGTLMLTAGYVPAVIGGALSSREEDEKLYIPVAGPWLTLSRGESESGGEKTLLVLDGAVQGVGALGMLLGLVIPERTTKNWYLIGSNERFQLTPQGMGLGARGRF